MAFELTTYQAYDFANRRHIGPSPEEMAEMLETVGVKSLDELIDQTIPEAIRQDAPLDVLAEEPAAGTVGHGLHSAVHHHRGPHGHG